MSLELKSDFFLLFYLPLHLRFQLYPTTGHLPQYFLNCSILSVPKLRGKTKSHHKADVLIRKNICVMNSFICFKIFHKKSKYWKQKLHFLSEYFDLKIKRSTRPYPENKGKFISKRGLLKFIWLRFNYCIEACYHQ